ncbi:branched-chain amino acid ABC transporter permease [Xanthobacter flavus]|uniref:branched-chain amino acid ABC transporter permease n=1 Tax=Xanthobacter flavus TaxID=281 RepID=UPI003729A1E7
MPLSLLRRRNVMLALVFVAALLPLGANPYHLFVANLIFIYILLSVGLNLLLGYAGQLAFANAAMFGIGAYGTGLLQVHFGWPFLIAFPAGALIATAVGLTLALPALRLSGLYLALSTLAFAQFTQWVFLHWEGVTFGAGGFKTPQVSFAPLPVDHRQGLYYLSLVIMVTMVWFAGNIVTSRVGRAFITVRDSEVAAESLGVDLLRYKALAFGLSAFYAGIAGGLYSQMLNFVSPEGYDLFQMVLQKAMVVVGGLGSIAGSVLGAGTIILVLELLREFKGAQEVVFGALLLVFIIFMRGGIVSVIKRHIPGWEEPLHRAGALPPAEPPTSLPLAPPAQERGAS